jgi:tRNA A37 N6-isopentenylltransferase MiaA
MSAGRFVAAVDAVVEEVRGRGRVPILVGGTGLYLRAWRLGLDDTGESRGERTAAGRMEAMLTRPPRPIAARARFLLVDADLAALEPRMLGRAEEMFARGIVEESLRLAERLPPGHRLLDTLGTAEALALARAETSREEAVARTTLRTRQYARRQRTWFKKEPWWRRLDAMAPRVVEDALSLLAPSR